MCYAFGSKFWEREDIEKLRDNYLEMSLDELSQILDRGTAGIVQKLHKLLKENPEKWDVQRVRALHADWHRDYRRGNRERINAQTSERKETRNSIYISFVEKQRKWTDRDTIILANTYFTRDYQELVKIFALKDTNVDEKLRQLYEEDPNSWEEGRIGELEQEAKSLFEQTKTKLKGYFSSIAYFRGLDLREDIDELVESGKTYRKIRDEIGMSHEGVRQYILSRNLKEWYDLMRSQGVSRKV